MKYSVIHFKTIAGVAGLGTFMDNRKFSGILHGQCIFHAQLGLELRLGFRLGSIGNNWALTLIFHGQFKIYLQTYGKRGFG